MGHGCFAEVLGDEVRCVEVHFVLGGKVVLLCSDNFPLIVYSDEEGAAFGVQEGGDGFEGCEFYRFVWLVGVDVCSQRGFEFSCF